MIPDFFCPACGAPLSRPGAGGQFRSDHFRCPRCKQTFDVADALQRPPRQRLYWVLAIVAACVVLLALWLLLRG
jgi:transposase-like protein